MDTSNDLEWISSQVADRWAADDHGRLASLAEVPVPRFVLMRTACGTTWRLRSDLPLACVKRLAGLASRECALPPGGRAAQAPERLEPLRRALESCGQAVRVEREAARRGNPDRLVADLWLFW